MQWEFAEAGLYLGGGKGREGFPPPPRLWRVHIVYMLYMHTFFIQDVRICDYSQPYHYSKVAQQASTRQSLTLSTLKFHQGDLYKLGHMKLISL